MLCESIIQVNGETEFDPFRIKLGDKLNHVEHPGLGLNRLALCGEAPVSPVFEDRLRLLSSDGKCQLVAGVSGPALHGLEAKFQNIPPSMGSVHAQFLGEVPYRYVGFLVHS